MLQIQQYVRAKSLDEAYELLNKHRNNQILGGMMWLKMQNRNIPIAIDLCELPLQGIEETKDHFVIQAMTSLRDIETHEGLQRYFKSMFTDALSDIVGVQFRNMATLGGSLYARFGFSDVLTLLLALDCEVYLHHHGKMSIKEYAASTHYERDILTHITIKKETLQGVFLCMRNSATDLSILNMAAVKTNTGYRFSIGARPKRAVLYEFAHEDKEKMIEEIQNTIVLGSNMRGSQEYRERLLSAFIEKAFYQLGGPSL
ncbi:FAD binding domain-containing protein [[Eubacterium] hominis]|uniref:FAD binding domain-containing protein n=1 Tax=[Eubacterium] hominis TaxID=2764325 RepID=UPI003A4D593B